MKAVKSTVWDFLTWRVKLREDDIAFLQTNCKLHNGEEPCIQMSRKELIELKFLFMDMEI